MCTGKLLSLVATLLAATTLGCRGESRRTIIVDGWWARDFAVQACVQTLAWHAEHGGEIEELGCEGVQPCPHLLPVLLACTADSAHRQARVFAWQVVRALASEPTCDGVTVAQSGGPGEQDIVLAELMRRPHRMLAVDYLPGLGIHSWTLLSAKGPSVAAEGEGAVRQIARDVCAAVTGSTPRRGE